MNFLHNQPAANAGPLRDAITNAYLRDETECVSSLLAALDISHDKQQRIHARAHALVDRVRLKGRQAKGFEAFIQEYDLSSAEGLMLMCLAEALLRIPDDATADRLILDKLGKGQWSKHFGHSHSLFVNASTWGLMLTGRFMDIERGAREQPDAWFKRFFSRLGEPMVRSAMRRAMKILGQQFVMGETIDDALQRGQQDDWQRYRFSFDMLGEAALTKTDAQRYFSAYEQAISAVAQQRKENLYATNSVSIKLSALHPRYHLFQQQRVQDELAPRLLSLAQHAMHAGVALTLDAEESDRLELSLDLFSHVFRHPSLSGWNGFGLAVQAYQKRAIAVIDWLADLARRNARRIPVRLVKGAYWDSEIKRTQEQGLSDYPVFTRKSSTDLSYMVCAARLLAAPDAFYPQFATHNAHTVSFILEISDKARDFEFQRLHGMGDALYDDILTYETNVACRVYAPVGGHKDLLAYLVRRLLENGANSSFVNQLVNNDIPIEHIIADPVAATRRAASKPHPKIPLPSHLFGAERRNSAGANFFDPTQTAPLAKQLQQAMERKWEASPIIAQENVRRGEQHVVRDPSQQERVIGTVYLADERAVDQALSLAAQAAPHWDLTPPMDRAACLDRAANLFEEHRAELIALIIREAGRTAVDAHNEVREAVDFCRYYAMWARRLFAAPQHMPGYTGENNELSLHGRGVFACISPWNFPLAIFTGQIAAALAAGNAVIAKPAFQTPLIAAHAVRLLHHAGIPGDVLHLLPGHGNTVGSRLACDPRVAGIVFTGSTITARNINTLLSARPGPIIPFIAETGGQNAMIVDSSALPDQVVNDVMQSAFNSAGQRCSALRVLFLQEDIAPRVIELLSGAMAELRVGDPASFATDIGPIIDEAARGKLIEHIKKLEQVARLIARAPLGDETAHGSFLAPHAFALDDLRILTNEVFGPVLHVVTFNGSALDEVIESINHFGYGLTLGVHSRIDSTVSYIRRRVRVGNMYVNRNMIGAIVGVQPFGGENLSGTGPKAGGPHYLLRFATERCFSINTAATGGNTTLLSLRD